jgi:hypothetical protein
MLSVVDRGARPFVTSFPSGTVDLVSAYQRRGSLPGPRVPAGSGRHATSGVCRSRCQYGSSDQHSERTLDRYRAGPTLVSRRAKIVAKRTQRQDCSLHRQTGGEVPHAGGSETDGARYRNVADESAVRSRCTGARLKRILRRQRSPVRASTDDHRSRSMANAGERQKSYRPADTRCAVVFVEQRLELSAQCPAKLALLRLAYFDQLARAQALKLGRGFLETVPEVCVFHQVDANRKVSVVREDSPTRDEPGIDVG